MITELASLVLAGATFSVLLARFVPQLNPLLYYGKVLDGKNLENQKYEWVFRLQVAKRRFVDFYFLLGAICGLAWLTGHCNQALVMLSVQSVRRVYESCIAYKGSTSRMHISHYLVGLVFYTIQGISTFVVECRVSYLAWVLFVTGSYLQHHAHMHLASLAKYNLPHASAFRLVACPHYTAEMVIYTALALACPTALSVSSLVWVVVNLSVSAEQTVAWYQSKYSNAPKYAVIPGF